MECPFPVTGEQCESTFALDNQGYYQFLQICGILLSILTFLCAIYFQMKLYMKLSILDFQRLDQRIILFVTIASIAAFIRALDPLGWGGKIPITLNMSSLFVLCSSSTCSAYCAMKTFSNITASVVRIHYKLERILSRLLFAKLSTDFVLIILMFSARSSFHIIVGYYYTFASIFYASLHFLSLKITKELFAAVDELSLSVDVSEIKSVLQKVGFYSNLFVFLAPVMLIYNLAIGIFYFNGSYDLINNVYRNPNTIENGFARFLYSGFLDLYAIFGILYSAGFMILLHHFFPRVPKFDEIVHALRLDLSTPFFKSIEEISAPVNTEIVMTSVLSFPAQTDVVTNSS